MIIYKITNKINNKIYIGQTTGSLQNRWWHHCKPSSECVCLSRAIQKYGRENFTIEQIDCACSFDELDVKERYWIEYYDSMDKQKGYNLQSGGHKNHVFSEETRLKLKNSLKNSVKFKESCRSESRRRKLSESHKGLKQSPETIAKKIKHHIGRKASDECRQRISDSRIGRFKYGENPNAKVVICLETGELFDCILNASIAKNINKTCISAVCRGKRKTAGGYHWRFADEKKK